MSENVAIAGYTSLRTEMISRIESINNQASVAWTTILTAWVMGISLYIIPHAYEIVDPTILYWLGAAQSISMLLPVFFLLPMSVKSGENLTQIVSLSCYIRVFYENVRRHDELPCIYWETANNAISSVNTDKGRKSLIYKLFFNQEYLVLAMTSMLLFVMFSILNSVHLYNIIKLRYFILSVAAYLLLAFVSLIAIKEIRRFSCIKTCMMENAEHYTKSYIRIAIRLGLFEREETSAEETDVDKIYKSIYDGWAETLALMF